MERLAKSRSRLFILLIMAFALEGCHTTEKFSVAPGYVLIPTLTAVASILPVEEGVELLSPREEPKIVEPSFSFGGFLRDRYALERTGIYFTEEYDPEKIPILFVHGLLSDPYTWRKLTRRLSEDPEIASRYQFWYYAYSTSLPPIVSATTLRRHLDELDRKLRKEGKGGLDHKLVICGHSVGGIMSKSLVSYSGDELWRTAFRRPIRSLNLEENQKDFLEDTFLFEPHPAISRAIIMAAPIRGTHKVRTPLASIGKLLGDKPDYFDRLMKDLVVKNVDALDPDFLKAYGKQFDSITSLDPALPLTSAYAATRIDSRIPFHSISGVSRFPKHQKTDGWVPVESTVLKGAVSHVEVESKHSVQDKEITAEIVKLILRHHSGLISESQMVEGVEVLGLLSKDSESAY